MAGLMKKAGLIGLESNIRNNSKESIATFMLTGMFGTAAFFGFPPLLAGAIIVGPVVFALIFLFEHIRGKPLSISVKHAAILTILAVVPTGFVFGIIALFGLVGELNKYV
jgi:hypothetical protein